MCVKQAVIREGGSNDSFNFVGIILSVSCTMFFRTHPYKQQIRYSTTATNNVEHIHFVQFSLELHTPHQMNSNEIIIALKENTLVY